MNADRETNHDMTRHDIALLLADAADEVEIGIAPTQALIRGGRRRRARRWAVAAAATLVVAGSTGALAVTGLPGGDGGRTAPAATRPAVTETRSALQPVNRLVLASGTDGGRKWRVALDVWPAPIDVRDARATVVAMAEYGETPSAVNTAADLVGKSAYFVLRSTGDEQVAQQLLTLHGVTTKSDALHGHDVDAVAVPLSPYGQGPARLVIGKVAKSARQVTCTWKNGTKTQVDRAVATAGGEGDAPAIRATDGSPYDWFVCLAPAGTEYRSAEVTR
ncbi:hypothetical protein KMT30_35595 [Streptomyces sp. IBSBF 2953]|uniref:hypothetical protein n=1 Tax=Streptomyces TaxID=1883 RepID=UPI00211A8025|nr:hypothetical protein [Streptomyces scabiei]MCQ9184274.1 hypothetical protein [Streptomyces hayashii]MDX3119606.1 hypothetical protein [Streptomyces scabiei]